MRYGDQSEATVGEATVSVGPLGDTAVLLSFGETISRGVASWVRNAAHAISDAAIMGVGDVVPAYTTIAVYFDNAVISYDTLVPLLRPLCNQPVQRMTVEIGEDLPNVVEIPVLYNGADMDEVAEQTGLSVETVIERHSSVMYYAYMLGFVPGFAYLGDLHPSLILPRRAEPRQRVPAGSVAIAGAQTAVYPLITPGGWHIIGTTAVTIFDVDRDPPALIRAGDSVRFVPVHS
ncbi:MAG: 5-oxoprolinase subunit PxpB [Gemmatimonadaceae bacterium]